MESKHTKEKWKVISNDFIYSGRTCIARAEFTSTHEDTNANAAHIVKCVNAHDELLSQIKNVLMSFGSIADNLSPSQQKCIESLRETYTNLTTIKN